MMQDPSIYNYILAQEKDFETEKIRLGDNWNWNFRDHVQLIFHLKNGIFFTGENNWLRAFRNIMDPILSLAYWSEDIELKDVMFFIENRTGRVLSFFLKKYHDEVYVKETNLDQMFDEVTESDLDYGGALVQKTPDGKPETFALNHIAFCDQTDILGGPIGFYHYFSPDKLRQMKARGWGDPKNGATMSIEELITLAEPQKDPAGMINQQKNVVPGKSIKVYVVVGNLPEHYLEDNDNMEDWYNQVQIVAFYYNKDKKQTGVTLYRKKEVEGRIKFHTTKKVAGRALGRGEGEALLHPQIWTNFMEIHKNNLIEAAGKVVLYTDDPSYSTRNAIRDMENLEVTTVDEGKTIQQVPTVGVNNIKLFEGQINMLFEHAQTLGSAYDPMLGKEQSSGQTFRGQERTVAQGSGIHNRRRGQRAKFFEEIYRDWIIPDMLAKMPEDKEFMATLSADELQWVGEQLAESWANKMQADAVFNLTTPDEKEVLKQKYMAEFSKKGNKLMLKILKKELKNAPIRMGINIANKQKDLLNLADKLLSILQFFSANPQAYYQMRQDPQLNNAFQDLLEYSGIAQSDFASVAAKPPMPMQQPMPAQPQQQMPLMQPQEAVAV